MDTRRLGKRSGLDRSDDGHESDDIQRIPTISAGVYEDTICDDIGGGGTATITMATTRTVANCSTMVPSRELPVITPKILEGKRIRSRVVCKNRRQTKKSRIVAASSRVMEKSLTAAGMVGRFMRKFAVYGQVTRVLARATMNHSPAGISVEIAQLRGHKEYTKMARSLPVISAMQRFVCHCGVFNKESFGSISSRVFSANVLMCVDMCAHPHEYTLVDGCHISVGGLVEAATRICDTLFMCRSFVVDSVCPWSGTDEFRLANTGEIIGKFSKLMYSQYTDFISALRAWRRASSGEFVERYKIFLFNLYDSQVELRKGILANTESCLRKPYLHAALATYTKRVAVAEEKFRSRVVVLDAVNLLEEIKAEYTRGGGTLPGLSQTDVSQASVTVPLMSTILLALRSSVAHAPEMIHHESVLDNSFRIKHPHNHIDDAYLLRVHGLRDRGFLEHMRMDERRGATTGPIYMYVIELINRFREHLDAIGFHAKRAFVLNSLSQERWKSWIDNGDVRWGDILKMLKTCSQAIQLAVGSEEALVVLYERRIAARMEENAKSCDFSARVGADKVSRSACSDMVRAFTINPGLYQHVVALASEKARGNGGDKGLVVRTSSSDPDVFERYKDRPDYALGPREYDNLIKRMTLLLDAEKDSTPGGLALLTIEALLDLEEILGALDVNLANAELGITRAKTLRTKIQTEELSFTRWFSQGLGTKNTRSWLMREMSAVAGGTQQTSGATFSEIHRVVFGGYVSLITGEGMLELPEETYPELLLLDIPYINESRSVFYGLVIQATVLLLVGKRLTDMSIHPPAIKICLDLLSLDPAFTSIKNPETCRAAAETVQSLQSAILRIILDSVEEHHGRHLSLSSLLHEVSVEASHRGYPSSPIASYIAKKWTAAMRMGLAVVPSNASLDHHQAPDVQDEADETDTNDIVSSLSMKTLSSSFESLDATYVAFSSNFVLPKAALCLSRELHTSVTGLVKRTWFNSTVHRRKYEKLLS